MYISEIAPLNLRGGLGTVNQLAVTIGLLLSQVLGIEQILGTNDGWPVLLGLAICPAILQLLLLPICPESPRYLLITKQWEEEARKGNIFFLFQLFLLEITREKTHIFCAFLFEEKNRFVLHLSVRRCIKNLKSQNIKKKRRKT